MLTGASCPTGVKDEDGSCLLLAQYARRSGPRKQIYWNPQQVCGLGLTGSCRCESACAHVCKGPAKFLVDVDFYAHMCATLWAYCISRSSDCTKMSFCMQRHAGETWWDLVMQVTAAVVTCGGLCPGLNDGETCMFCLLSAGLHDHYAMHTTTAEVVTNLTQQCCVQIMDRVSAATSETMPLFVILPITLDARCIACSAA